MDRSFKKEYPEHKKYHKKKKFPTWIIIIICFIISSICGYLFLQIIHNKISDVRFKRRQTSRQANLPPRFSYPKFPKIIKPPKETTEKIYSWTDEDGIKHFSNVQPSQNSKNVMTTN